MSTVCLKSHRDTEVDDSWPKPIKHLNFTFSVEFEISLLCLLHLVRYKQPCLEGPGPRPADIAVTELLYEWVLD